MNELLKYLIENDKIDITDVAEELKLKQERGFLNQHEHEIWKGKDGKWYTYLPDEKKGRVLRKRNSKKELENLIISFYKEKADNPTIREIFYEWLNRKISNNEIGEPTYTRYQTDFERCFFDFGKYKIKDVDEIMIEDFLKGIIKEKNMSQKAYSNLRTIMYGMFKYAKKKKYINYNIKDVIADIDFSKKEFNKIEHSDIEQVFFVDEEKRIIDFMMEKQDLRNLGLILLFFTGMRIGELSTLKHSDIQGNIIQINRTEIQYKDRETGQMIYTIKDAAKSEAGIRRIVVKDEYLWILKKIKSMNPFGEFLFMDNGERIRSSSFRNRLYYNCEKCKDIVKKSPHKARKTYGTKLYDSDLPDSIVCDQMGHTDITCLKHHYYYNRLRDNQKSELINKIANI